MKKLSSSRKQGYRIVVWMLILAALATTIFGLSKQHWPNVLPWNNVKTLTEFGWLLAGLSIFVLSTRLFIRKDLAAYVLIIICVSVLSSNAWPFLVTLIFILSSFVVGKTIFESFGIAKQTDSGVHYFLIGAGVYGTLIGLLAHFPINYPGIYAVIVFLPLFVFRSRIPTAAINSFAKSLFDKTTGAEKFDLASHLLVVIAVVHLIGALMPELQWDSLVMHLMVPSQLYFKHQWGFDPALYAWALIPMLANWIFSIGYLLAGETGARLINLTFCYLLAFQAYQIARWLGGDPQRSKYAALLFLSTPLAFTETHSLLVEAVWGAYIVAGSLVALRLIDQGASRAADNLKTGSLMFGLAASTKAITLAIMPVLLIISCLFIRKWYNSKTVHHLCAALFLFLLVGSIPYVTAWCISGNPTFPFFNGIFESSFYPNSNFVDSRWIHGISWDILYRVVFESTAYLEASNGAPGFQWLVLLPVTVFILIARGNRNANLLLVVCILSISSVFYSTNYLRYIFPIFALVSALISVAVFPRTKLSFVPSKMLQVVAILTVSLNILFLPAATWSHRALPLHVLFSPADKDAFITQRSPVRRAVELINQLNLEQAPVAFLTGHTYGAGLNADALVSTWHNHVFNSRVRSMKTEGDLAKILNSYDASYFILSDRWGSPALRALVESESIEIKKLRGVTVRKLIDRSAK